MVGRACCFLGAPPPRVTHPPRVVPGQDYAPAQGFALGYRPPALQAGWMCLYEAMHPPHCSV